MLLAHDVDVVLRMRRRRGGRHEILDGGCAADGLELAERTQVLIERDCVHRHGGLRHRKQRLEKYPVLGIIEGIRLQTMREAYVQNSQILSELGVDQYRSENTPLCLRAVRRRLYIFFHGPRL